MHAARRALDPGRVALQLGLVVGPRPASVAIHDDGDVAGQVLGGEELLVGSRWRVGRSREGRSGERCAGH